MWLGLPLPLPVISSQILGSSLKTCTFLSLHLYSSLALSLKP